MDGMRKIQSKWNMIGDTLVHEEVYNWENKRVGFSNIKLYGRELTKHNRNKPLNRSEDVLILYLCGQPEGYDNTPTGYMLKRDKFYELTNKIIKKYKIEIKNYIVKNLDKGLIESIVIRLKKDDIGGIIQFLYELEEDDLVGNIPNKQAVLEKWSEEFLRIQQNYSNKIAIFLELYE